MRKLIISNIVSLDGYAAGPGGNPMLLPMDGAFNDHNAERLRAASTLLMGRSTFEMFSGYWPAIAGDEASDDVNREISRLNGAIDKVVVSDGLELDPAGAWTATTEVVSRSDAHARIATLKAEPGADILSFGSLTLAHDLLAAGLVDELHLLVGPVVLGAGIPMIATPLATPLELLEARTFEGSGNVLLRYGV